MNTVPVQIKFRNEKYRDLTAYQTLGSAAFDLRANITETLTIQPGDCVLVDSGLSVFIDNPAYAGFILPRSGLGHKEGVVLGNGTGLIDSDYQGQLMISVFNRSKEPIVIEPDARIAQYYIAPVVRAEFKEVPADAPFVSEFEGDRGEGGFGSTGKQ